VKEHTSSNLRLAEQLGAETQALVGRNVADVLLEFAHSRNVTKIVAGKTAQPRWKHLFTRTVIDQLLAKSGDIDIYIVSGEGETPSAIRYPAGTVAVRWREYLLFLLLMMALGYLVFIKALGMPIPIWPSWLLEMLRAG
jgi:two-component system sensor histidine kinase KdpD